MGHYVYCANQNSTEIYVYKILIIVMEIDIFPSDHILTLFYTSI